MIQCKNCGASIEVGQRECPRCHSAVRLSEEELAVHRRLLAAARETSDTAAAEVELSVLSAFGGAAEKIEYARFLMKSGKEEQARRPAEEAAALGDAEGAYLYYTLLGALHTEKAQSDFWLRYASLLGSTDASFALAQSALSAGARTEALIALGAATAGEDRSSYLRAAQICLRPAPGLAVYYLSKIDGFSPRASAMRLLLKKAQAEEPETVSTADRCGFLRRMLEEGKKCGADLAVRDLLTRLCGLGDAGAQCELGSLVAGEDFQKAKQMLITYAEGGNADAYLLLSQCYTDGRADVLSYAEAGKYADLAAKAGLSDGFVRLGDLYTDADNPHTNFRLGIAMYERAALAGSEQGAERKAQLCRKREELFGHGAEELSARHPGAAFSAFALSAAMGYAPALVALGDCYGRGIGTGIDRRRAFLCYESAAKAGLPDGHLHLGDCYRTGFGVDRDFAKSRDAYTRALGACPRADAELKKMKEAREAHRRRRMMSGAMRLIRRKKYLDACERLTLLARSGDAKAMYTLGALFEFGLGVEADARRADRFYELARQSGFVDERTRYKLTILRLIR